MKTAFRFSKHQIARESLMLGAVLAGMAFSNSSVAQVHGMSRPVGAYFHIADGLSNAMLLAEITNFSIRSSEGRYAECALAAGWAKSTESKFEACQKIRHEPTKTPGTINRSLSRNIGFL